MKPALFALCLAAALAGADDREILSNPAALPPHRSETVQQVREAFVDPPAEYRSMPLWVWNDEMAWPRLKEQLAQFKAQGIGGVFVHPRPGLMTEYLSPEWFSLWRLSMEEGKRLGLFVNIYDENSYPAGFSGGLVPARAPDTAVQYVEAVAGVDAARISWNAAETVAVFVTAKGNAKRVHSRAEVPENASVTLFRLRRASGNPWTAEFPYVDLTNPQTAPNFIETTFEAYRKQFGAEFGKTVRWSFDDEPLIATGGAYDPAAMALPLSFNTLAEFRKRCGYDLTDKIVSLFWDTGDFRQVRFDYWQTLHDLWKENYFRPIFQWCDRNNLQFTGHWMEHEWPYPWISPDDASLYAYEHVPGIDMLEGANIRVRGADPHMLFTIKQVASVANQLGRRAFCEAYGVSGWDSTLEHYKRFGDWLMVHGINFIDQHLAFSTVRGARKRDHPQSFSDVSPWWPYYRVHADHLARVSYLLSRGAARNRVVLIEPTTSGFLFARRAGETPELEKMRKDNADLIQALADRQVDFDLADEYILEWFGKGGKSLKVGKAEYDLVVWPKHMVNVRRETVPLLEDYLAAGGEILALAEPADYVDGRPNDAVRRLRDRHRAQWRSVPGPAELIAEIQKRLPAQVTFDHPLPQGVGFAQRALESGERVLFFANTGLAAVKATATVEGAAIEGWDTVTGRIAPAPFQQGGNGKLSFELDLPPAGSRLFVVTTSGAPPVAASVPAFVPLAAPEWDITPDAPNVLVLDYCDLALSHAEFQDINTWRANWSLWQAHGFERPAWDNAVQFKTRVFDRNHFDPQSGFEATFRFDVADAAAVEQLELALESPELYRVSVNGQNVSFEGAARWLDPHIRSVPIATLAHPGENVIKLTGRPFDVRMELENVYLRGNFSVVAGEKGFRLAAPGRLKLGSWAKQGYPFYGHSMLYQASVEVPADRNLVRTELPDWAGSVAEVLLDGKQVAVVGWQPYSAEFQTAPGKHTIGVRVVSTPRNTFGPFHNPSKPRMRAWPAAWHEFPERQPGGALYDVLDYGLLQAPVITAAAGN